MTDLQTLDQQLTIERENYATLLARWKATSEELARAYRGFNRLIDRWGKLNIEADELRRRLAALEEKL